MHTLTGGISFYVQKLGFMTEQRARSTQVDKAGSSLVQSAFSDMLLELESEFEARWINRLPQQQRQVVKGLALLALGACRHRSADERQSDGHLIVAAPLARHNDCQR